MIKEFLNKIFKNPKTISFKQGFELTDMPICTFYQGEERYTFLLDTGSNDNIIDSNILDKIIHTKSNNVSSLFGLEGNSQPVECCTISLEYANTSYVYDYLIVDMKEAFSKIKQESGVTLHGLIGSRFFNKYKYVLDFDKLIAYSKQ